MHEKDSMHHAYGNIAESREHHLVSHPIQI